MAILPNAILRLNIVPPFNTCNLINRFSTSSTLNYVSKVTVEEKLGIKPKPKRPLTPYIRYLRDHRQGILDKNPQINIRELVKLVSSEWRSVDDSLKAKYQDEYKNEYEKYAQDIKKYEQSLTPTERLDIENAKNEAKATKLKRALKKQREELGCPKRPPSSYINFMKEKLSERGNEKFIEFQKKIRDSWEKLSETEKKKYDDLYKKELEVYKEKLTKWNKEQASNAGVRRQ